MELSSFSQQIVKVPYLRGTDVVELSVDIDAFTPKFFREAGNRFKEKLVRMEVDTKPAVKGRKKHQPTEAVLEFFETEAKTIELSHEVSAELLANGVLVDWTVTENGVPVRPTKDVLMQLSPRVVKEMWELCINAAKTVKKREDREDETNEETSENTHTGSMALRAVGQSG